MDITYYTFICILLLFILSSFWRCSHTCPEHACNIFLTLPQTWSHTYSKHQSPGLCWKQCWSHVGSTGVAEATSCGHESNRPDKRWQKYEVDEGADIDADRPLSITFRVMGFYNSQLQEQNEKSRGFIPRCHSCGYWLTQVLTTSQPHLCIQHVHDFARNIDPNTVLILLVECVCGMFPSRDEQCYVQSSRASVTGP